MNCVLYYNATVFPMFLLTLPAVDAVRQLLTQHFGVRYISQNRVWCCVLRFSLRIGANYIINLVYMHACVYKIYHARRRNYYSVSERVDDDDDYGCGRRVSVGELVPRIHMRTCV